MRVCLVGDISGVLDEGAKNTTYHLAHSLSQKCEVWIVSPRSITHPSVWFRVKAFTPEVIHYIMGPSWRSFLIARFLSLLSPRAVVVMSALRPKITSTHMRWLKGFLPDLFLVQSMRQKRAYDRWGFRTRLFPAGVDVNRFLPVTDKQKRALRIKHDLPVGAYLVLHVGQITHDREIRKLIPVQASDTYQVVVIGAGTIPPDDAITSELIQAGCIIRTAFVEQIEELYQLADVYVFPGSDNSSAEEVPVDAPAVEIPLSVIEAMACNLPVISGHFGGLPLLFDQCNGFLFADTSYEILTQLDRVRNTPQVETRAQVLWFSWANLANELLDIYKRLLIEKN